MVDPFITHLFTTDHSYSEYKLNLTEEEMVTKNEPRSSLAELFSGCNPFVDPDSVDLTAVEISNC